MSMYVCVLVVCVCSTVYCNISLYPLTCCHLFHVSLLPWSYSSPSLLPFFPIKMHFFSFLSQAFFTMLNYHHDHLCHHHSHHLHHRQAYLSASGNFCASTEEYLSLLVLSEFSRTPVFIPTEQPDQPFQFPQPDTSRGLRNGVCRWWEQHFWGQPESEGLFVSSQESWSTRQQHEPVQLLVASSASNQWDQAQLYRLQWGCFSGGWEFTPVITCGAPSTQSDGRYGLHRR